MRFAFKFTDNFLMESVLKTFGVSPTSSFADLSGDTLEIAMGIWFHEKLPVPSIARVAPSDWPWWAGLGVKLHHHGVGVVGSTEGVVNVQLKAPTQMNIVGMGLNVTQLWLSVEDREGFLKAVSEEAKIAVSPHTPF